MFPLPLELEPKVLPPVCCVVLCYVMLCYTVYSRVRIIEKQEVWHIYMQVEEEV